MLRRASQEFNVKVRELAVALLEYVSGAPAEQPAFGKPIKPDQRTRDAAQALWATLSGPCRPRDGPNCWRHCPVAGSPCSRGGHFHGFRHTGLSRTGFAPSSPMTIRQFTSDPLFRQRYWARNHVGWRHMDQTSPNAGHRALADWSGRES